MHKAGAWLALLRDRLGSSRSAKLVLVDPFPTPLL
jgi:hypothetical protein